MKWIIGPGNYANLEDVYGMDIATDSAIVHYEKRTQKKSLNILRSELNN